MSQWVTHWDLGLQKAIGLPLCFCCCLFGLYRLCPYVSIPKLASGSPEDSREPGAGSTLAGQDCQCWALGCCGWLSELGGGPGAGLCELALQSLGLQTRILCWTSKNEQENGAAVTWDLFVVCTDVPEHFSTEQCAAPVKHLCPWQQHPLVCSSGTLGITHPPEPLGSAEGTALQAITMGCPMSSGSRPMLI